jgi:hypothetical protein
MLMKGGKIPDYIFKSAQVEEVQEDNIMESILSKIEDQSRVKVRDVIGDEQGITKYFIVESIVNISDIEKSKMINYLSQLGDIEDDEDLEISFKEYLMDDFNELQGYSMNDEDYFEQLAAIMAENHVGSCEILDVNNKEASIKDNEIYVSFEMTTYETNTYLKDKFLGV